MQFQPKSDDEIKAEGLWPEGKYGFEIVEEVTFGENTLRTEDTISKVKENGKGGNEMIQLVVRVYNDNGNSTHVIDFLLEAFSKKLKNAAYACGLGDKYEGGLLQASDFIGKQGNLYMTIQKGKPKDDGSGDRYPDRNSVADYERTEQKTVTNGAGFQVAADHPSVQENKPVDELEDEIPF